MATREGKGHKANSAPPTPHWRNVEKSVKSKSIDIFIDDDCNDEMYKYLHLDWISIHGNE